MKWLKSRLWVGAVLWSVTAAGQLRAEPLGTPCFLTGRIEATASLSLATRFGAGSAPFYTESFPSVHGHGVVATLCGTYAVGGVELGLSLPGAIISVEQLAGAYVDEVTWGNPTWSVLSRDASDLAGGRELRWFGGLGIALPLAEHGAPRALLSNRALALASAFEGWRDQQSYLPGRLSLVPRGGLDFSSQPWRFEASVELPVLFEVSSADLPEDSEARAVGFTPVIHSGVEIRVGEWFVPQLNADLVLNAVAPVEGARDEIETLQFVLRPELGFVLRGGLLLSSDFLVPLGGALGGSNFSSSLRLTKTF